MTTEEDRPTRVIVSAGGEQFAPRNFVLVYLKDGLVESVIAVDDMTYNESLLMISEVSGTASAFVDEFVENFYDEEGDKKEEV